MIIPLKQNHLKQNQKSEVVSLMVSIQRFLVLLQGYNHTLFCKSCLRLEGEVSYKTEAYTEKPFSQKVWHHHLENIFLGSTFFRNIK